MEKKSQYSVIFRGKRYTDKNEDGLKYGLIIKI